MQPKYQADMRDGPEGRESKPRPTSQDFGIPPELLEKVEFPEPVEPRRFQDIRLDAAKKALADAIPGIGAGIVEPDMNNRQRPLPKDED